MISPRARGDSTPTPASAIARSALTSRGGSATTCAELEDRDRAESFAREQFEEDKRWYVVERADQIQRDREARRSSRWGARTAQQGAAYRASERCDPSVPRSVGKSPVAQRQRRAKREP